MKHSCVPPGQKTLKVCKIGAVLLQLMHYKILELVQFWTDHYYNRNIKCKEMNEYQLLRCGTAQ
jgi:hypothetical protein